MTTMMMMILRRSFASPLLPLLLHSTALPVLVDAARKKRTENFFLIFLRSSLPSMRRMTKYRCSCSAAEKGRSSARTAAPLPFLPFLFFLLFVRVFVFFATIRAKKKKKGCKKHKTRNSFSALSLHSSSLSTNQLLYYYYYYYYELYGTTATRTRRRTRRRRKEASAIRTTNALRFKERTGEFTVLVVVVEQ